MELLSVLKNLHFYIPQQFMNLAKTIYKLYVVYCCMLSKCFPDHKASGPHQSFKEGGTYRRTIYNSSPHKTRKNEKFRPIAIP
jgi:hypothetical protein